MDSPKGGEKLKVKKQKVKGEKWVTVHDFPTSFPQQ
jgi:hypothetical protein